MSSDNLYELIGQIYATPPEEVSSRVFTCKDATSFPGFDLKYTWWGESRWKKLLQSYLLPEDLERWWESIRIKPKSSIALPVWSKYRSHRNGTCLVAAVYHPQLIKGRSPGIELMARASIPGLMMPLDIALLGKLAQSVSLLIGQEVGAHFHTTGLSVHSLKSMPALWQPWEISEGIRKKANRGVRAMESYEAKGVPMARHVGLVLCMRNLWMVNTQPVSRYLDEDGNFLNGPKPKPWKEKAESVSFDQLMSLEEYVGGSRS